MLMYEFHHLIFVDDICDYFGVKISMYFAWLGFYTNSMLYPAVIGFLLWILAESDQVLEAHYVTRFVCTGPVVACTWNILETLNYQIKCLLMFKSYFPCLIRKDKKRSC